MARSPRALAAAAPPRQEDAGAGAALADLQRRLEPAQARHGDVHHRDIRLELDGPFDRLAPVGGFADDLHVIGEVEERLHAFADDGVIVGEQHANLSHVHPPGGPAP